MEKFIIVFVIGYFLGNIQTSYLLGKLLYQKDIRMLGHGNAGASNALVSFGFKFGLMVAFVDVAKGLVSIVLVRYLYQASLDLEGALLLYVNAFAVISGHIFPFLMGFKGGKGTATLLGVLLGFHPLLGIGAIAFLIAITLISDRVAIAAGALSITFVVFTAVSQLGTGPFLIAFMLMVLSLYKHIPNYKRILNDTEGRLSDTLNKSKKK